MLGLLLGALAVGAICSYSDHNSSVYKKKENNSNTQGRNYIQYRQVYVNETEKVTFFDNYRALDNYLGRLVGKGSGGVTLLINTIKHRGVNNSELESIYNDLRNVRDYRNNLAHNKNQWNQLPNPRSSYNQILSKVRNVVVRNESSVAKAMYYQAKYYQ